MTNPLGSQRDQVLAPYVIARFAFGLVDKPDKEPSYFDAPWDSLLRAIVDAPKDRRQSAMEEWIRTEADPTFADMILRHIMLQAQTSLAMSQQAAPVVKLSQIAPLVSGTEWLWKNWIPRGYLTMLAGMTGIGKSSIALRLAKTFLDSDAWPDGSLLNGASPPPGRREIVWLDTEGSHALLLQRAQQWNIDLDSIVWPRVPTNENEMMPSLRLDDSTGWGIFANVLSTRKPFLAVIDTLRGAFRGDENSSEVATMLQACAELARDTKTALLVIHHLRKASIHEVGRIVEIDRIRGSSSIANLMRSIIALDQPDPDNLEHKRMRIIKSNLCKIPDKQVGFWIEEDGTIEFGESPVEPKKETNSDRACDWLQLALVDGAKLASEVFEQGEADGFGKRAITEAKRRLGIVSTKQPVSGKWSWSIPGKSVALPSDAARYGERDRGDED